MSAKRKHIKFSGVGKIYDSKEAARNGLIEQLLSDTNNPPKDGEMLTVRYREANGVVTYVNFYVTFVSEGKFTLTEQCRNKIITSKTPPTDTEAIWIDDSESDSPGGGTSSVEEDLKALKNAFLALTSVVNRHEYAFSHTMNSGDIYNSAGGAMMAAAKDELTYYDNIDFSPSGSTTGGTATDFDLYIQNTNLSQYDSETSSMQLNIKQPYYFRVVTVPEDSVFDKINVSVEGGDGTVLVKYGDSIGVRAGKADVSKVVARMTPSSGAGEIVKTYYLTFNINKEPNYPENSEPNVKHLIIKSVATYEELKNNIGYLCFNELIWCESNNGLYILAKTSNGSTKLVKINGGGGGGNVDPDIPINPDDDNDIMEGIIQSGSSISMIEFISSNGNKYNVNVNNDGELVTKLVGGNIASPDGSNGAVNKDTNTQDYVFYQGNKLTSGGLFINSVYCGGVNNENDDNEVYDDHTLKNYCSHNFIELSNTTKEDKPLNGLSIQYCSEGSNWKVLPLVGTIKAGSTFLIRGSQCAYMNTNTTVIKVNDFDMEWNDNDGTSHDKKIQFSTKGAKFFLTYGTEPCELSNPYVLNTNGSNKTISLPYGYIDLVGFDNHDFWNKTGITGGWEGNPQSVDDAFRNLSREHLYTKYYNLDPVKQANKDYTARVNRTMWYYVDLSKKDGEIIRDIKVYTPASSKENKNFYFNKTVLKDGKPTVITCSFGIKAVSDNTVTGSIVPFAERDANTGQTEYEGATRCFNWTSKDYYDEYLWVRKSGTQDWGVAYESITDTRKVATSLTVGVYDRVRQEYSDGAILTAHKQILYNIAPGEYEYVAGHKNEDGTPDLDKCTPVKKFTVEKESDVTSENGFTFIQTSDQQGFNWDEYRVWKIAAEMACKEKSTVNGKAPAFMINTGDMTQNGNRINEWLDYFEAKEGSFDNMVEMATIGNNDLSPKDLSVLGFGADADKINAANITFYYTFEVDEENPPIFRIETNTGKVYANIYVPSLYSFNYGNAHFVCVNSEISYNTENIIYGMSEVTSGNTGYIYDQMKAWCDKDIALHKSDWNIAYCHEMPFTIMTQANMNAWYDFEHNTFMGSGTRGGSRINTVAKPGNEYWFSEFCQENNIRLVIGGHKHTQSTTWPLMENVVYSDGKRTVNTMSPIIQVTTNDLKTYFGCDTLTEVDGKEYPSSWVNSNGALKNEEVSAKDGYKYVPSRDANFCQFKLVTKITAPVYAMSQSSGYKHTSNKELPCGICLPWDRYYYPALNNKANGEQKHPFYTVWTVKDSGIYGEVKRVQNIFKGGLFEVNEYFERKKTEQPTVVNGLKPGTISSDDNKIVILK